MASKGIEFINLLSDHIHDNPSDMESYIIFGTVYREQGQILKAIKIHSNILAKPDLKKNVKIRTMVELANDFYSQGNLPKSKNIIDETLKLDSKNRQALYLLFKIYKKTHDFEKAVSILEKISKTDTKILADTYLLCAKKLIAQKEPSKARKYIKKALNKWPENIEAHTLYGDALLLERDYKEAVNKYFEALRLDYTFTSFIIKKVQNAFYQSGSFDDFSKKIREELSLRYDNSDLHLELGRFLLKKHLSKEAKDEFAKALDFNPTNFEAREELLKIEAENNGLTGKTKKMIDDLFQELKQNTYYFCTKCSNREKEIHWKCPSCASFNSYEKRIFLF